MTEAHVESHTRSDDAVTYVVVAVLGALLGFVIDLLYRRYLVATVENFGTCGTFSECSVPEGNFLLAVLLASVLVPLLAWPVMGLGRSILLGVAGPFIYLPLGIVLIGRFGFGPWTWGSSLLLIIGSTGVLLLEALVVRRGIRWRARFGALALVGGWVVVVASLLTP